MKKITLRRYLRRCYTKVTIISAISYLVAFLISTKLEKILQVESWRKCFIIASACFLVILLCTYIYIGVRIKRCSYTIIDKKIYIKEKRKFTYQKVCETQSIFQKIFCLSTLKFEDSNGKNFLIKDVSEEVIEELI